MCPASGDGVSSAADCACVQVRSQQISLVQVRRNGSLVRLLDIGRWCQPDDAWVVQQAELAEAK
jgi:hypothetical protein